MLGGVRDEGVAGSNPVIPTDAGNSSVNSFFSLCPGNQDSGTGRKNLSCLPDTKGMIKLVCTI